MYIHFSVTLIKHDKKTKGYKTKRHALSSALSSVVCVTEELRQEGPGYQDNVFYFAGSAFLAAGLVAVSVIQLAICLKVGTCICVSPTRHCGHASTQTPTQ